MAKVVLINPPIYDFAAFDLWARPLGLLYVAAFLEKAGHEVRIVDCLDRRHPSLAGLTGRDAPRSRRYGTGHYYRRQVEKPHVLADVPKVYRRFGIPERALADELAAAAPADVVGVTSTMTYWYPGVVEAVEAARKAFPQAPVVLGGIYATLCGEHAREVVSPDYLVSGPGEAAMARIVAEVAGGDTSDGQADFAALPRPAYHLLANADAAAVITGRGCPFRCAYCAVNLLSPRIERRAPAEVAAEIDELSARFGAKDVAFYDDALLWDADNHFKPLVGLLAARRRPVRFHTPNGLHARFVDAGLARAMRSAGFVTLRLSLETVAEERRREWDEKVDYGEFVSAAQAFADAGFEPGHLGAYVMMAAPGETPREAARNIAAAHAAGVQVRIAEYSAVPGTALFARAAETSRRDLCEPLLHNNSIFPAAPAGTWAQWQRLKDFAAALNRDLLAGRVRFSPAEVVRRDDFTAEAGV